MRKKIILIVIACVVAVCAGVGITLFVVDSNRQQQEEQHIANITQSIADWETSFDNAENREHRANIYAGLADFRDDFTNGNVSLYHERVRGNHRENVISNFNNALASMENWFYDYYMTAISEIETQANENLVLRQVFIGDTLTEIEEAHTGFLAIVENDLCYDCENHIDDCDDCDCHDCFTDRAITISYVALLQYREFLDIENQFTNNGFINDKIETAENLVVELENIRLLIVNDGVITGLRLQELDNRINALIGELSLQLGDDDRVGIVNQFATFIDYKQTWFLDYYENIFTEVAERERIDPYDRDAIMQQIADLESLRRLMRSESVIDTENMEAFTGRIDELVEKLHEEDHEIWQRFLQQQQERQQQQQQRQQQTAPPADGGQQGQQEAPPATGGGIVGRGRAHHFIQVCLNDECDFHTFTGWFDDEEAPNLESIIVWTCPECGERKFERVLGYIGISGGGG